MNFKEKEHQELIDEYNNNEKLIEKVRAKTFVLEILMIGIVVYMKSIQETASLRANIIATSFVTILLCIHFLDFYPKRSRSKKMANLILKGVNFEDQYPYIKPQFFKKCLKDFNALGYIIKMAVFDIFLIYFFSVSYTQLLKAINPGAIVVLRGITPFSTWAISLSLGWAYYRAIRSLAHQKSKVGV